MFFLPPMTRMPWTRWWRCQQHSNTNGHTLKKRLKKSLLSLTKGLGKDKPEREKTFRQYSLYSSNHHRKNCNPSQQGLNRESRLPPLPSYCKAPFPPNWCQRKLSGETNFHTQQVVMRIPTAVLWRPRGEQERDQWGTGTRQFHPSQPGH